MFSWTTLLLLAAAPPPVVTPAPVVALPVTALQSADGEYLLVTTRWTLGGPGFAGASAEVFFLGEGDLQVASHIQFGAADAARGEAGAEADARAGVEYVVSQLKITEPVGLERCDAEQCGAGDRVSAGLRTGVHVHEDAFEAETCPQGWAGTVATLSPTVPGIMKKQVIPRPACARAWRLVGAYLTHSGTALLLGFEVPDHEGSGLRYQAVAWSPPLLW